MNIKDILEKIEVLTAPILENLGLELIEREFVSEQGRWVLRLYIDRVVQEGGPVTIDDCATASRAMSAMMDIENPIPGSYSLEVSSPGLERPLRRKKDFERFVGETVSLKTHYPIPSSRSEREGEAPVALPPEGATRAPVIARHTFTAVRLQGVQEENIIVRDDEKEWIIPLEAVKKAKLKIQKENL